MGLEFYDEFVPAVERHSFHGWTAGAMWEDLKFDLAHWNDIKRLAIVGETTWQKGKAVFCKPFTKATIRYFDHSQIDEARESVAGD